MGLYSVPMPTDSNEFARDILARAKEMQKPYADHQQADSLWAIADRWLRNPDNDCLRARGDYRWQQVCEAETLLRNAMNPF